MADEFQMSREVAEKMVLRAMKPLREILNKTRPEEDGSAEVPIKLAAMREMDTALGAIATTLAGKYRQEKEYQDTIHVMAEENVRLHAGLDLLTDMVAEEKKQNASLADALVKSRNVNEKLQHLEFHAIEDVL